MYQNIAQCIITERLQFISYSSSSSSRNNVPRLQDRCISKQNPRIISSTSSHVTASHTLNTTTIYITNQHWYLQVLEPTVQVSVVSITHHQHRVQTSTNHSCTAATHISNRLSLSQSFKCTFVQQSQEFSQFTSAQWLHWQLCQNTATAMCQC